MSGGATRFDRMPGFPNGGIQRKIFQSSWYATERNSRSIPDEIYSATRFAVVWCCSKVFSRKHFVLDTGSRTPYERCDARRKCMADLIQEVLRMLALDESDGQIDVIGVNKGGGAKTTTAINKSTMQQLAGVPSLLVDCAPEAHSTFSLGYWPHQVKYSVYDLLLGKCTLKECIVPTYYHPNPPERAFFCPTEPWDPQDPHSPTKLDYYLAQGVQLIRGPDMIPMKFEFGEDGNTPDEILRGRNVRQFLLALALQPARKLYAKIDIDVNPDLINLLTMNALYAADNVVIPFVPDQLTAIGIKNMLDAINMVRRLNGKIQIAGVLLSKVREQKAHRDVIEPFRENMAKLNIRIFQTVIAENPVKFLNAQNKRSVVVLDDPLCDSSVQFWTFLAEAVAVTGGSGKDKVFQTVQGIVNTRQEREAERLKKAETSA